MKDKNIVKEPFPYGYLLLGFLVSAVGICFILLRETFTILALAMGIIIIIFSLVLFSQALLDKRRGFFFVCKLVVGLSGIACGIISLIVQSGIVYILSNIIYLLLIIDGAYKVGSAFHSQKYYLIRFWITLAIGAALVVCAFLMSKYEISQESDGDMLHGFLTGALLVGDGILNFLYAFFRSSFHNKEPMPEVAEQNPDEPVPEVTEQNPDEPVTEEIRSSEEEDLPSFDDEPGPLTEEAEDAPLQAPIIKIE